MKKIIFLFSFTLLATLLFSQDKVEKRGFYFAFGGGYPSISYPEPLNSSIETLENSGVDRIPIAIDISMGVAISNNSYFIGSISGVADRLENATSFVQFNTYLYSLGIRFYPFTTGLVLGGDLGSSRMVIQGTGISDIVSDSGFGYNFVVAYDFDKSKTGFTFLLGIKAGASDIEGDSVAAVSLFGNLTWK